jgi:hypothetical protein
MRDEIDGRMWVEHHQAFGEAVDRALDGLRAFAGRFAGWDGSSHQLLVIVLAFAVTALSFRTTVV